MYNRVDASEPNVIRNEDSQDYVNEQSYEEGSYNPDGGRGNETDQEEGEILNQQIQLTTAMKIKAPVLNMFS